MNYSSYRISLNNYDTSSQIVLNVKQSEKNSRRLIISLKDGSNPYEIADGCRAVFTAEKPDGNQIYNECTIEDNLIIYVITPQTTAAVGFVACEIKLYDENDDLLISPRFGLLVEESVFNDQNIQKSGPEFNALKDIVVSTVTAIMEENPISTDATLSKINWAADAKTVGDKFTEVDKAIAAAQSAANDAATAASNAGTAAINARNTANGRARKFNFSATVAASAWVGDAPPYTQTVAVTGIALVDNPHFTVELFGTTEEMIAQEEAFALISKLETAADTVTFTCLREKPEISLDIAMEVIR